jgi:hypothetical protein
LTLQLEDSVSDRDRVVYIAGTFTEQEYASRRIRLQELGMNARFVALLLALLVAGCSQDELQQKFASAEDQKTAKTYIDHLRAGRFSEIEAVAAPTIRSAGLRDTLEQMSDLMPDGEPTSIKLVGAYTMNGPDGVTKNITFEYDFAGKWFLLNVATHQKSDALTIVGFNVNPQPKSLQAQNRFELAGKTPIHYTVLTLAVLFPVFTLYVLILCARTKMVGRKWPWILFILLGIGKLAVNWTTGEWQLMPLAVQLFSGSVVSMPYGPTILAVSLPLGAAIFLFKRRALRVQAAS